MVLAGLRVTSLLFIQDRPATQRLVSHLNDRDVAATVSTTRDRDRQHSLHTCPSRRCLDLAK